jgi:hypothetical protein
MSASENQLSLTLAAHINGRREKVNSYQPGRNVTTKLLFGAALLFALMNPAGPLYADQVDIDVFIAQSGKVSSAHIGPGDCAIVAESAGPMAPAHVGLAFADSQGQWGAARRQDLLPDFGLNSGRAVLTRADQTVPVQHGNTTVSLPMQLLFQPRAPISHTHESSSSSASARLPLNATRAQIRAAAAQDNATPATTTTTYETLSYALNVLAYPDSREITFRKFCEPCDEKADALMTPEERAAQQRGADVANQVLSRVAAMTGPLGAGIAGQRDRDELEEEEDRQKELEPPQRVNWNDMGKFLELAFPFRQNSKQVPVNKKIVVRGTVSRVDMNSPAASTRWANIFFRESPDGTFNVCSSSPDIFQDLFGPDFRSTMVGKTLEIKGEVHRQCCGGAKAGIRITLSRQLHSIGPDEKPAEIWGEAELKDWSKARLQREAAAEQARQANEDARIKRLEAAVAAGNRNAIVPLQAHQRDADEAQQKWKAPRGSPGDYEPRWIGENIVLRGTVSRVRVKDGSPSWLTVLFKESPDAAFVVCSPSPEVFRERFGRRLSVLVGKTLEVAGQVEQCMCAGKAGSIRVVEPSQLRFPDPDPSVLRAIPKLVFSERHRPAELSDVDRLRAQEEPMMVGKADVRRFCSLGSGDLSDVMVKSIYGTPSADHGMEQAFGPGGRLSVSYTEEVTPYVRLRRVHRLTLDSSEVDWVKACLAKYGAPRDPLLDLFGKDEAAATALLGPPKKREPQNGQTYRLYWSFTMAGYPAGEVTATSSQTLVLEFKPGSGCSSISLTW